MKMLFAGNKQRGISCLNAIMSAGHDIVGVIANPDLSDHINIFSEYVKKKDLLLLNPSNINQRRFIENIRLLSPDLIILAGYSQIVGEDFIHSASLGCINLHAGKLPQYRGSSPMNWAIINGEREITLSIIRVDIGVDTGDVLLEKTFSISDSDTIANAQKKADSLFPEMLISVINNLQEGELCVRKQDPSAASYYPLRFPDDGLIIWDQFTAIEIHNRIRALTSPYPCAFTFLGEERVKLISSSLTRMNYYGEPGRVYRVNDHGLLVCALDKCLWIHSAFFECNEASIFDKIKRYDKFVTMRDTIGQLLMRSKP